LVAGATVMRRCTFHVGSPKPITTSIQSVLNNDQALLLAAPSAYPRVLL
jgi:hypothetical protein